MDGKKIKLSGLKKVTSTALLFPVVLLALRRAEAGGLGAGAKPGQFRNLVRSYLKIKKGCACSSVKKL